MMISGYCSSPVCCLPLWNQVHIRKGEVAEESFWAIEVERDGDYKISPHRWPVEAGKGINDGTYGKAFTCKQACLKIADLTATPYYAYGRTNSRPVGRSRRACGMPMTRWVAFLILSAHPMIPVTVGGFALLNDRAFSVSRCNLYTVKSTA